MDLNMAKYGIQKEILKTRVFQNMKNMLQQLLLL